MDGRRVLEVGWGLGEISVRCLYGSEDNLCCDSWYYRIKCVRRSNRIQAIHLLSASPLSHGSTSKPHPQPRRVHLRIIHTPSPLATVRKAQSEVILHLADRLNAMNDRANLSLLSRLGHLETPHQRPRQRPNIVPIRNIVVLAMPIELFRYIAIDIENINTLVTARSAKSVLGIELEFQRIRSFDG